MLAQDLDTCKIYNQNRCAAFSKMMEDQGIVVGVEHIPELYKKGFENLSKSYSNLLKEGKIILKEADGRLGSEENAPYDCIHVGAACEKVPKSLVDQLKPGGRIMIPVGKYYQFIWLVDKDEKGNLTKDAVLSVRYIPLTDKEKQLAKSETNVFGFWDL
jgi:protein-L-isoaspartate(D-aspartate) O-methyltransferase